VGVTDEIFATGHSLGQVSALGVENVLGIEDTLILAKQRGEQMQEESEGLGGMVVLATGADERSLRNKLNSLAEIPEVQALLIKWGDLRSFWEITVQNAATRFVLGGLASQSDLLRYIDGPKLTEYPAASLSHTELMIKAQIRLNELLESLSVRFRTPYRPILGDIGNNLKASVEQLLADLKIHLVTPIDWNENTDQIVLTGADVVEVGGAMLKSVTDQKKGIGFYPTETWEQIVEVIGKFGTPKVFVLVS